MIKHWNTTYFLIFKIYNETDWRFKYAASIGVNLYQEKLIVFGGTPGKIVMFNKNLL